MGDRFLRACRREPVDCTPVWFMRQAGRYLAEYQAVRAGHSILEVCKTPGLAVEVTLQPVRRFAVDAAIIFADILLPLEPMGLALSFESGEGPVIANPVRTAADISALRPVDPDDGLGFVLESIRQTRAALAGEVPLIGFAGAPFTLASYAIEGGGSRNYVETKRLMYSDPETWHGLMGRLAEAVTAFLRAQVVAGAQAVQLFDSWVGALSPDDYAEYAYPYSQRIFRSLADCGVPRIHFGTGATTLLPLMANAGCDVVGLDWRVHLDEGWAHAGHDKAVQGNLDPVVLFAPEHEIERRVLDIVKRADGRPGHIFNLGHGILPGTPPEAVGLVADLVHRATRRSL
ncbi:MAG TPA: uroporphyrinogen decarboxylase [Acidimicrobiia bacterium]|nr:uroporphyrinogen decarboxylase [Acidimicrobiia bacterium]